jgi:hypothetical protein
MFGHLYLHPMNPRKDKITRTQPTGLHPRRFHVSRCVRLALAFALSTTLAAAQTPVRNRITQAIDDQNAKVVRGNVHGLARAEFDQGRMDAGIRLEGVTLAFRPSTAQQKDLDKLLVDLQDPKSPVYHQWLTPDQFEARFGMSDSDLAQVKSWLISKGFTVEADSPLHTRIKFNGTVAQLESAFRMEMHRYRVKGDDHFANATEPSMPAAFANLVGALNNLHNFRPKARAKLLPPQTQTHLTSGQTGNIFMAPGDFAVIYDLNPLYNRTPVKFDGTGQTIAVVGQTALASSSTNDFVDVNQFRLAAGLPAKQPTLTLVPSTGSRAVFSSDLPEADLDVEWSGAVAKNATINYVYVGNNTNSSVFDAFQYAVDQKIGSVISTSYGFCETQQTPGFITQFDTTAIAKANTQGQTITAAAGDAGAADCESSTATVAVNGLAVDHPASNPGVTGLGGTEFSGDNPSPVGYWAPETPGTDVNPSALQYIPETTWNDTAGAGSLDATGGGTSVIYTGAKAPTWQHLVGVPLDGARHVPDVSLDSSNGHDPYLICSAGSCVTGFRKSNGDFNVVGGTSVAAPSFAGIVAILNQATGSSGLGNINPTLYTLAATKPNSFHDITSGNNVVPCASGSPDCPLTAPLQFGYTANACYDQVTGIGTIDANNLVTNWATTTTAPNYTISATTPTQTISAKGQPASTNLTITSVNNFAGTVDLACTPPAGLSEVDCTVNPSSVTLTAGGSASATLNVTTTAFLAAVRVPQGEIRLAQSPQNQNSKRKPYGNHLAWLALGGSLVAGIFFARKPSRRKVTGVLFTLALGTFALTSVNCGGGSSAPPPAGKASFSASSLPFGNVTLNATDTAPDVTLTNVGTAALSISTISSSSALFTFASNCGSSLAIGALCVVRASFTPTATGNASATLNVPNGDSTAPQSLAMSGTGVHQAGTPTGAYTIPVAATTNVAGYACAQQSATFTVTVP